MNKLSTIPNEIIMNQIYLIREHKVMIDRDLASLYGVETKQLKRQVNRNIDRFPEDFMFELTEKEFENWRRQIGTSNLADKMGLRYAPYVFTEQGVAMLSSVLNSRQAIAVNIQIIRVFTQIRKMPIDNTELRLAIEEIRKKTENNTKNIEVVFQYMDEFLDKKEDNLSAGQAGKDDQKLRKYIGYKLPKKKKSEIAKPLNNLIINKIKAL
jgi:hypothetical protein